VVAIAAARGLPDYPFAVIDHPIAHNDGEALRVKAEQVVDQLVRLLTTRTPPDPAAS
jgi:hypothetical protein